MSYPEYPDEALPDEGTVLSAERTLRLIGRAEHGIGLHMHTGGVLRVSLAGGPNAGLRTMPDGRPSAPWCMVQLSSAKPSKKALTSCAVAAKGSPFNFSTEFSPATAPMPAPMSTGNTGGIMCGGQGCMGNAPSGIAAPYMAGRSG